MAQHSCDLFKVIQSVTSEARIKRILHTLEHSNYSQKSHSDFLKFRFMIYCNNEELKKNTSPSAALLILHSAFLQKCSKPLFHYFNPLTEEKQQIEGLSWPAAKWKDGQWFGQQRNSVFFITDQATLILEFYYIYFLTSKASHTLYTLHCPQ